MTKKREFILMAGLTIDKMTEESDFVGGIFQMDYEECKIYTSDFIKHSVSSGLEKHAFLVARMREQTEQDFEEHVILMRIIGSSEHPLSTELTGARYQNMEERVVEEIDERNRNTRELDAETKAEIQKTAVKAEPLGTFYNEDGELKFGGDVHTVFPSGEYKVYKPSGQILSDIVNFSLGGKDGIKIGDVKYSSSNLFSDEEENSSEVRIHTDEDLVEHKTALFGMTRTGKSNTMKILASAIHLRNDDVGQLIFDPSGEYAYETEHDEYGVTELGDDDITVYKYGATQNSEEKPLGTNMYNEDMIEFTVDQIEEQIEVNEGTERGYLKGIYNAKVLSPDRQEEKVSELVEETGSRYNSEVQSFKNTESRKRSAVMGLLSNLGLKAPRNWDMEWQSKKSHVNAVSHYSDDIHTEDSDEDGINKEILMSREDGQSIVVAKLKSKSSRLYTWSEDFVGEYWKTIRLYIEDEEEDEYEVIDEEGPVHKILKSITSPSSSGNVDIYLSSLQKFHNPDSDEKPKVEIYKSLMNGELVIVDTTNGSDEVTEKFSRSFSQYIKNESMNIFRDEDSDDPPKIQIYLEEAHRYFSEDEYDSGNTYVTLAKEGAKFNIGLVYATQEVSMVDDRILSNTANWVVTHLNNDNEIDELTDYYDFESFENKIKKVDDKGFARIKTKSGDFVLPVQVSEFGDWIDNETEYTVQGGD